MEEATKKEPSPTGNLVDMATKINAFFHRQTASVYKIRTLMCPTASTLSWKVEPETDSRYNQSLWRREEGLV